MFYPHVSSEAIDAVVATLRGRWIGQGPKVEEFERRVQDACGVTHAVAVSSGAAAVRLALAIAGVQPGDEVITTPMCCTATNHPILEQFARPVFADIQYETANIDPADVARRVTDRTKAILCVHWGGYPSDLEELNAVAHGHGIPVIEDASDALGATYHGRPVGSVSPFTAFSFQAIQQVTTGEGGMLALTNPEDREAARRRRWFGIDRKQRRPNGVGYYDFDVSEPGYGYHMTDIAAAMGVVHLAELPAILSRRSAIANRYRAALSGVPGVRLLECRDDRTSAHHLFTIHVERRPEFARMMAGRNIETSIVHERNDIYAVFGGRRADLPALDRFAASQISIPLNQHLSDDDVEYVVESIRAGW